ncbi:EAL domain-containing protein [Nakamurella deserti]|uniref:sensor domain-containing phosphodiesterase n=1 Tax=Nakamurella deserti TaxID=2164074 RepID=UPI0014796146|nr:EAL domain-containing protein [Nakamurella deserti]
MIDHPAELATGALRRTRGRPLPGGDLLVGRSRPFGTTGRVGGGAAVRSLPGDPERMADVAGVIRRGEIHCVFQPIVELDGGAVVAFEALARGPVGPLQAPDALFDAARNAGLLTDLDELCRVTAIRGAAAVEMPAAAALFVNVEPQALRRSALQELLEVADAVGSQRQLVLEITERALATAPAELLAVVEILRAAGWRIALDDVGADDMSLAFMAMLRPDILKIDMNIVQRRPDDAVATLMSAVNAHAESTGCVILAEGIETAQHLAVALALGATLGQGWYFGRPTPDARCDGTVGRLTLPAVASAPVSVTPFASVPTMRTRTATKPLLIQVSQHLERQAADLGATCVVLSTFQHARFFTPATRRRYAALGMQVGFVAAFGTDMPDDVAPGVRGAHLDASDYLCAEWDIVVLSPHFAAALIAREVDGEPDGDRRFEFVLTYDRAAVVGAAASLMARVGGERARVAPVSVGDAAA